MTDARPDPLPIIPLSAPVDGVVTLPGSKSITNRALVCAALAGGTSTLEGVLLADDTEAMIDCLTRLGARVGGGVDALEVSGTDGRLEHGPVSLDARLSGTTSRFVAPVLLLGEGAYVLDGAESLRRRPMGPVIEALEGLGAVVEASEGPGHLPVVVRAGPRSHRGGRVEITGDVSSQFASGLLLAGPSFAGGLDLRLVGPVVSRPYLDLTVAVMQAFGARVTQPDERTFAVEGSGYRSVAGYRIEPDASAASYAFAAAAITDGRVRIEGLGRRSLQGDLAFAGVLGQMGAEVTQGAGWTEVRGTGSLHGITIDMSDVSDTAQTLAVVAVFADSPTEVTGIGFIRRKETDRLHAVVTELRRCGIDATETDDGFRITPGPARPAVVQTYDDHRMAMSFALIGLRVPGISIADPGCVAKTFPDYWDVLAGLDPGRSRGQ